MPLRVAVVDDEPSVRKSLQRLLRTSGLDVETFATGEELLASAPASFDCVLLDLHMSGTGGMEVVERLEQLAPRLPVVMLTGNDLPEFRARALEAGVRTVLTKPSEARVLLAALRDAAAPGDEFSEQPQKKASGGCQ